MTFITYGVVELLADRINLTPQFYERLQSVLSEDAALLVQDSIAALSVKSPQESILISIISLLVLIYAVSGVFFLTSIFPEKDLVFANIPNEPNHCLYTETAVLFRTRDWGRAVGNAGGGHKSYNDVVRINP